MLFLSMSLRKATRGCAYGMYPEMKLRDGLQARYACGGCLCYVYIMLSSLSVLYISAKNQTTIGFVSISAFLRST